jgi:hypothetical protein
MVNTQGDVVKLKKKYFSLFGEVKGDFALKIFYARQVIFDKRKKLTTVFTGAILESKEN